MDCLALACFDQVELDMIEDEKAEADVLTKDNSSRKTIRKNPSFLRLQSSKSSAMDTATTKSTSSDSASLPSTVSGDDSTSSTTADNDAATLEKSVLKCDYERNRTPLFKAIEDQDWKGIITFLATGRWSSSPFTSLFSHLETPSPKLQARTWVISYRDDMDDEEEQSNHKLQDGKNKKGKNKNMNDDTTTHDGKSIRFKQLPIHAAICYRAPLVVIKKLVELYPDGVRCTDENKNLPIHLAFGFGLPDNIILVLLKKFPEGVHLRGLQDRRPVECSELGTNQVRGQIIEIFQDQARENERKEIQKEWKSILLEAMNNDETKISSDESSDASSTIDHLISLNSGTKTDRSSKNWSGTATATSKTTTTTAIIAKPIVSKTVKSLINNMTFEEILMDYVRLKQIEEKKVEDNSLQRYQSSSLLFSRKSTEKENGDNDMHQIPLSPSNNNKKKASPTNKNKGYVANAKLNRLYSSSSDNTEKARKRSFMKKLRGRRIVI